MEFFMKFGKLLTYAAVTFAVLTNTAFAQNNVKSIDVSAAVADDGSARIVQTWSGSFDEGTENYIPIRTDGIGISDFSVSDADGEYSSVDEWNIDASFAEKSRKCGINKTDEGVELCFGISEYGQNTYRIEYTVSDFIKAYSDADGTNFMFINPDMSTFPTDGKIDIYLQNGTPISEENAAIWAFGYDGQVEFADGHVSAYTETALEGDNSMIVMLRLDKGIIFPAATVDESFDEVKDAAFEGSDYSYDDGEATLLEYIIGFVILFAIVAVIVWIILFLLRRRKEIKQFYEAAGYFRDAPNGGDIEVSHYLAQNFDVADEESLIIGALMLSMINKGFIEPMTEESVGMFGKIKQSVNMKLLREPDTEVERRLYRVLVAAAGGDGVLQEKELEDYAYGNPKSVNNIIDSTKADGEAKLAARGGFADGAGNRIKDLSEVGKRELAEVMGLKKYLNDFSLIAEREIKETIIWQDYMVYATLFGIADKVIKQLEKVYPDRIPEFESYNRNVVVAYSYYHSMHSSAERAIQQQQRTDGMGGRASIGGGGGFSGGGSGGGSR